jgi:hypothetical protein
MLQSVMNPLKISQAFKVVFASETLVNRAYFFVAIPFISSFLIYVLQLLPTNAIAVFLTLVFVLVLNAIYQLYLWSVAFFYSQQISESDWHDYELFLGELFSDFGVKLRLLFIRILWNLPLIVLSFAVLLSGSISGNAVNYDIWQLLLLGTIGLLSMVIEVIFVNISCCIYSETNSMLRALNPILVFRLLFSATWDYVIVLGLAILPLPVLLLASIPLVLLLAIPIVGGLIFGLLIGIHAMYTTLFIPNLQGQIWHKLGAKING